MFHVTTFPTTGGGARTPTPEQDEVEALERLRPVVRAAATLEHQDAQATSSLRSTAADVTTALVASGHLPAHLTVEGAEPIVVIQRLLAAAWSHVTAAPSRASAAAPRGASVLARLGA